MNPIEVRLSALALRRGPLPYPEVISEALYGEGGFYAAGGAAGRERDFLTSPETGHLFGAVVARYADALWQRLGRPDPFWLVEAGCGTGTLCRTVLDAEPACGPALRYLCVERSDIQRAQIASRVALEPPAEIAGEVSGQGDDAHPRPAQGPLVAALADLPTAVGPGLVVANELLDNLPPVVLERIPGPGDRDDGPVGDRSGTAAGTGSGSGSGAGSWAEVRVDAALTEVLVPVEESVAALARRLAPDAAEGTRIPLAQGARAWLARARAAITDGEVVCFDYGAPTAELAERGWTGWARTYRAHRRGGAPLEDLGSVDVTFDVPTDQLEAARDVPQSQWLAEAGMEDLVEVARQVWDGRAGWTLEAMKARSRVGEGVTLRDPEGLGAFRVLTWPVA